MISTEPRSYPPNARHGEVRHFLENTIGAKHILIVFINENHVSAFRIVFLKHGDEAAGFTMAKTLGAQGCARCSHFLRRVGDKGGAVTLEALLTFFGILVAVLAKRSKLYLLGLD